MTQPASTCHSRKLVNALLTVFLLALLYNLGGWGVLETSEARYAEISREMLHSGDLLHPRLLGIQHYHKPPVTYMLTAAGMGVFGVDAFGARLLLQLSLLAQALLVYLISVKILKSRARAFTAFVVYLTMPAVLIAARNLTTDSFLTTFELLSIWAWVSYKPDKKAGWLYLFYLALAVAFLTKGPVGLIFPLLVVIGYRPEQNSLQARSRVRHHVLGLLLCLLVSVSWYAYLMWQDGQFVDYFILNHTVNRYARPETFGRSKPWWFYVVLVPALSLPWIGILFAQVKRLRHLPAAYKRLFVLWLLVALVFFSLSGSKLVLYVLPMFAGIALLVAWLLHQMPERAIGNACTCSWLYLLVLAVLLFALPFLPLGFHVPIPALVFPLLMLAGLVGLRYTRLVPLQRLLASAVLFTVLLLPYAAHVLGANPMQTKSSRPLAEAIREAGLEKRPIVVFDQLLPSLAFELDRDIISVYDQHGGLKRETQFERDEQWRSQLLDIHNPADSLRLLDLLRQDAVLLYKGTLPAERAWLKAHQKNTQEMAPWTMTY